MNKVVVILFAQASVLGGVLSAMTSFSSQSAAATLLPAATYYESAAREGVGPYNDAGTDSDKVGTVSVLNPATGPGNVYSAIATTAVRLSGTDTLNPFVSATSTYQATFHGFAFAEITYSFEVTGPAGTQVPLDLTLNGSHSFTPADPGATDNHHASFSISDPLTNKSLYLKSCFADTASPCDFSVSTTLLISTNQILKADLILNGDSPGPGDSQTSLGETIAIDPANTVSGATLVFSPGLVVSTPEPDTFWLLLAGFVGSAFAWRPSLRILKLDN